MTQKLTFSEFNNLLKDNELKDLACLNQLYNDLRFNSFEILQTNMLRSPSIELDEKINADVNLDLVKGTCNPKFDPFPSKSTNWFKEFNNCKLVRLSENLRLLKNNIDFYYQNNTNVDIEFVTFNGGESYYIVNGNHRIFIAKFLFALEKIYTGESKNTLSGVIIKYMKCN